MSYRYSGDAPSHTCSYLWPELVSILDRVAPAPSRILEVGCGNGSTARMLAARGYYVQGVDPSESGIAIARKRSADDPRLDFSCASTNDDLAGRFGEFPIVVSLEVIEHCADARAFMRSIRSVLALGGVAIISTPYHGYAKNLAIALSGRFDHHFDPLWENGHLKFFSIPKLRQLFTETGFARFEFRRVGRIPALAKSVIAIVR